MNYNEGLLFLLKRGHIPLDDKERTALFLIISRNSDLYEKVNYIYDFEENTIIPDCLENPDVDFSSSSKALIKLAFSLYNGYPADVLEVFEKLDETQSALALDAIKYRFSI